MFTRTRVGLTLVALAAGATCWTGPAEPSPRNLPVREVREASAALPLAFEENRGQTDPSVQYLARCSGMTAFISGNSVVLALHAPRGADAPSSDVVQLTFSGAAPDAAALGAGLLPGRSNYFIGADAAKWIAGVPNFGRVAVHGLYPGVDVVWHGGDGRRLTYDLVVAPHADPSRVALDIGGARRLRVGEDGALCADTERGELRQSRPVAWQTGDGARHPVGVRFALSGEDRVRFEFSAYDEALPLVIDPTFTYSTYLGGTKTDDSFGVAVDSSGAAYTAGATNSADFPLRAPLQPTMGGNYDICVSKINPAGTALEYSTYLGGTADDFATAVAVDANAQAYVAGYTMYVAAGTSFPVPSGFQTSSGGLADAIVVKLDPAGASLVYGTYLGGTGNDYAKAIAVDSNGGMYVAGDTLSPNFPTLSPLIGTNAIGMQSGFLTKINASGATLAYSTYLNGASGISIARGVAVDSAGAAYVAGQTSSVSFPTFPNGTGQSPLLPAFVGGTWDAFALKVNSTGSAFVYSTYIGGSYSDYANAIAVDAAGSAFVVGLTSSSNFPTKGAFQSVGGGVTAAQGRNDGFLTKLTPSGTAIVYSTFLGGTGNADWATGVALDAQGAPTVVGVTNSPDFPKLAPVQPTHAGGGHDGFVTKFDVTGAQILFSTFLGGSSGDHVQAVAVDANGAAYVSGLTTSWDFPVKGQVQPAYGVNQDAFVTKYPLFVNGGVEGGGTVPAAPSTLAVVYDGVGTASLSWGDSSTDETSFEIHRKSGSNEFSGLASAGPDATTYADTSLYQDTTFTYRVRAANETGTSLWTNEVSIKTSPNFPPPPPPKAPGQLVAAPFGSTSISLTWTDKSAGELVFELQRADGGDAFVSLSNLPPNTASYADGGLHPGWPYRYRVRALSFQGGSPWSNEATASTPATIGVTLSSGSLVNARKLNQDHLTIVAAYAPISPAKVADLDPEASGVELYVGSPGNVIVVSVPAGDAKWKRTKKTKRQPNGLATWKSAEGESPRVVLTFDDVKGVLTASIAGFELSVPPSALVTTSFACGAAGGAQTTTWTAGKRGSWRFPAPK